MSLKTLGKYQILEHLGRGGMSEVYKAYQPGLERYVTLKVLHPFLATEENFLARFQREAKAVAALRHPNIVQVFDFDHDREQDLYYMVIEFIDGPNLRTRLQQLTDQGQQMPLGEAVRIASAVGEALSYAHQRGMVHRDVKPSNIMFTSDGQVILTDFGIAKIVNLTGLTASGSMVGTPAYMSPEQGLGKAGDERSDIYSLGVVLYQLVTGVLPFDADTAMGIVLKHINEPLPSPRAFRADLPLALEQVLIRALAKDPAQRYQKAADFVADLRQALTQPAQVLLSQPTAPVPEVEQTVPTRPTPAPQPPAAPARPPAIGRLPMPAPSPARRPPAPAPAPGRRPHRWAPAMLAALTVFFLAVAGLLLAEGAFLPPVVRTPTPDLFATRLVATLEASQATAGAPAGPPTARASPSPLPTPTPTPTLRPPPATPTSEPTVALAQPLDMSWPTLERCWVNQETGQWGGRISWTAWGGQGAYRYYYGSDDTPQVELAGPYDDFTRLQGERLEMQYFTVSGEVFVWRKATFSQADCP